MSEQVWWSVVAEAGGAKRGVASGGVAWHRVLLVRADKEPNEPLEVHFHSVDGYFACPFFTHDAEQWELLFTSATVCITADVYQSTGVTNEINDGSISLRSKPAGQHVGPRHLRSWNVPRACPSGCWSFFLKAAVGHMEDFRQQQQQLCEAICRWVIKEKGRMRLGFILCYDTHRASNDGGVRTINISTGWVLGSGFLFLVSWEALFLMVQNQIN